VRESNVVRLMSQFRNREVETDLAGSSGSCGKPGLTGATKRALSDELNSMDVGAWCWGTAARGY